jgi:phospholipid/cholesterol/gamma-HCH transport system substrate-binding protein
MGKNKHALITGMFLIVLIAATTVAIYWIGHFERERNIYFVATNKSVTGLNPESTVFYRGIAVGKVLNIKFDPKDSGLILIKVEIDKNIVLTQGVFATLQLKGVTGLTQLQLEDSGKITDLLPPGDDPKIRIPLLPSITDKLMNSGDELLTKADHLMVRLSSLLNEENEKNMVSILGNLKTLSDKLSELEKSVVSALNEIPALTKDAKKTLKHIDNLSLELQTLSKDARALSKKVGSVADNGNVASNQFVETTLPKVNKLLTDLQKTTDEVRRIAVTLETNPKSVLTTVVEQDQPGPGEPGYKEPE